jgi:hypothetical protein
VFAGESEVIVVASFNTASTLHVASPHLLWSRCKKMTFSSGEAVAFVVLVESTTTDLIKTDQARIDGNSFVPEINNQIIGGGSNNARPGDRRIKKRMAVYCILGYGCVG